MTHTYIISTLSVAASLMLAGCSQEKGDTQLSNLFKDKFTQGCLKKSSAASCACVVGKLEKSLSGAEIQSLNSGQLNAGIKDKILAESKSCKK